MRLATGARAAPARHYSFALAGSEASHSRPISTVAHIAPMPAPIATDVFKDPAAVITAAYRQARKITASQQLCGRIAYQRKNLIQRRGFFGPLPFKRAIFSFRDPFNAQGQLQFFVKDFQLSLLYRPARNNRLEN